MAILCFELVGGQSEEVALANFALRFVVGLSVGLVGGLSIYEAIRRKWIPEDLVNTFTLAGAVLIFGVTEALGHRFGFSEAGLLSVVTAGFVLGFKHLPELKSLRQFKAEVTDLLIGMLFVLLAARLEFSAFRDFGVKGVLAVALVIFVIRPLNVLLSSWGSDLSWRERLFLSWVAPRGIVAASMAALFVIRLEHRSDVPDARFIELFTYSVIMSTVLLQGFTAGPLAGLLGLKRQAPTGFLIVGAHLLGRKVARYLRDRLGLRVLVVDINPKLIAGARAEGLLAFEGDARDLSLEDAQHFQEIGNLLALTDNEDLNALLCERWSDTFGREHLFRWESRRSAIEHTLPGQRALPGQVIWSGLPKPSLLSAELTRGEAKLLVHEGPSPDSAVESGALLGHLAGSLVFAGERSQEGWQQVLYLRREADYLRRSLRPELICLLDVQSQEELFTALIDRVITLAPGLPRQQLLEELIEREQLFPTSLGHGIAVPHAYAPTLKARLCVIARLHAGLEIDAPDDQPVRLVFLLLSPPGDPEGHLATLAEIARLCADEPLRQSLLEARSPLEILSLIQSFDPGARAGAPGTGEASPRT